MAWPQQLFPVVTALLLSATAGGAVAGNVSVAAPPCDTPSRQRECRQAHRDLVARLLSDASPMVPPNAGDPSQPVAVNITTSLTHLESLDTDAQVMTAILTVDAAWLDPSLSWDPQAVPVKAVYLPPDALWRPEIVPFNSFLSRDVFMQLQLPLKVTPDGKVRWRLSERFSWQCQMDIRLFPFDESSCLLLLGTWNQVRGEDVNFNLRLFSTPMLSHPEWDLVSVRQYRAMVPVEMIVTIKVRRKWLFHALNVLLPVALLSLLNCVVFVLPAACGEKMSVSVTTFLALAVFMSLIQDSLPHNSDTVCYLAVYLGAQTGMSAMAVVLCAGVIKCAHSGGHDQEPPATSSTGESRWRERPPQEPEHGIAVVHSSDHGATFGGEFSTLESGAAMIAKNTSRSCSNAGHTVNKAGHTVNKAGQTVNNAGHIVNNAEHTVNNAEHTGYTTGSLPGKKRDTQASRVNWPAVGLKVNAVCLYLYLLVSVLSFLTYMVMIKTDPLGEPEGL